MPRKIVYILGRFPALSETFVLQELLELERQGMQVRIFSLFKPDLHQDVEVVWPGRAVVTCLSEFSKFLLLLYFLRYFFSAPLRLAQVSFIMGRQYRLKFLVGCRALLFATFLATQFEHDSIFHMHAHFASEATAVAEFTSLLTDIAYSFTAHANDIYLASPIDLAEKIKRAHFVVTISAYNQRYLATLVDQQARARIHLIYNGLNLQDFPSPLSEDPSTQTPPLLLSVCRLVEKKGLLYLLEACRMLAQKHYAFTCHIVGDGPLYQELEQKIHDFALSDTVILIGARTHQQVREMYQHATIMVLPCIISQNGDRDGIPTVLIESLYAGVPTLSTAISGIPELITSEINGLLVPQKDNETLAMALARLLDDPSLRARFAAAGRKTVLERFNLRSNVSHLIHLFNQN